LSQTIKNFPKKLDQEINQNGDNLSLGEKQLISLVRVILRKSKILILDEATASLDLETDAKIQNVIRSEFKDATVLTIAHRLDTIVDSDRVMVLEKGILVEMDKPSELLKDQNSVFTKLVHSSLFVNKSE